MTEGVKEKSDVATSEEKGAHTKELTDKELNFRRLEAARDKERESRDRERDARLKAEMQNELLRQELENIKTMLQPKEKDPLEDIEDITDLDRNKLKEILSKREEQIEKRFEKTLTQKLDEIERNKRRTNFRDELRKVYQDYDTVMNQDVIAAIQEREPEAVAAISAIEDPYVRCESAYKFFKKQMVVPQKEEAPSIKERVEENMLNPYFTPSGQGSPPPAVEFDVKSPASKKAAYERLKAAQRRPIGNGQIVRQY